MVRASGRPAAISIGTTTPPVNDAPVVGGSDDLPPSNEDTPSPTGTPVGTLLGQGTINYTDGTDTVPGGSTGTPSAGIAITGNASTPAQGTWQYSTDGGTTWVDIPRTGLSDTNAIVLPNTAAIRFEPAPNWNGTPGGLTARISDGDTGLPPTGAADISTSVGGTRPVVRRHDLDRHHDSAGQRCAGGQRFRDSCRRATRTRRARPGTPVGTLLGQGTVNYTDGTDTVPGGSTGTPSAGIAITGNASTPAQGTLAVLDRWRHDVGRHSTHGPQRHECLVLPTTATLRFEPEPNWNGTPGDLTARISDGTGGLPPTGTGDISTGVGGTGQWSTGTILDRHRRRRRSTTRRW